MSGSFLNERVRLHCGDMRDVLARLDECSIDSCCTDPPYHLTSIVQRFGAESAAPAQFGKDGAYARASAGFMGKVWDGGDIAFRPETWAAVYRVLKPGAHLVAFGGTRTFHRLACAIEDARFEIRDTVSWLYGSGFPKSHDVSKGIDRAAGAEREVIGERYTVKRMKAGAKMIRDGDWEKEDVAYTATDTAPATDAAREWQGWGTALKPAMELCVLARKPLSEGTVAANCLRWGTGAINVDGCRVAGVVNSAAGALQGYGGSSSGLYERGNGRGELREGRWPANVVHDGGDEVVAAFPETHAAGTCSSRPDRGPFSSGIESLIGRDIPNDSDSAARFFYTAKANQDDRLGSSHPTVKPLDLMQWLVRLITPPKGIVLDCFAGTGTTGEAAWREGMSAVLIEAEPEYQADIRRRMALALAGPDERARESIKAKNLPRDDGPLFASRETWADDYNASDDFARSIEEAYRVIRERKANGGKGWGGWE